MSADEMNDNLTPGEREFHAALSRLHPAAGTAVDPLSVAFDAGRHAARRSLAVWRATAAVLLVALSASAILRFEGAPADTRPNIVQVPTPAPAPRDPSESDSQLATYYALRNDVIERGIAALPEPAAAPVARPVRIRGGAMNDRL